ncbi:MAG: glycine cleavage system protein GcvH [Caldicoprobacterales bacterium]|jgi:glycine cleavage system H protein|nr:glycine cleavage system protein GcvH [Clostridia bacterium]MDI9513059.1 glycine cleavage system protein GcvH [Bacillota bacterium]NLH59500.1 glycine cleavage system protein GcvH [Clostridiales bacterium]
MKLIEGLYYSKDHEWVKVEGEYATIGITDYAQDSLGDVVYVELPDIDDELDAGDEIGIVESVKAASDIYTPLSGKVVAVNEELVDTPEAINKDPYASWIIKLEISQVEELEKLMTSQEYEAFIKQEG